MYVFTLQRYIPKTEKRLREAGKNAESVLALGGSSCMEMVALFSANSAIPSPWLILQSFSECLQVSKPTTSSCLQEPRPTALSFYLGYYTTCVLVLLGNEVLSTVRQLILQTPLGVVQHQDLVLILFVFLHHFPQVIVSLHHLKKTPNGQMLKSTSLGGKKIYRIQVWNWDCVLKQANVHELVLNCPWLTKPWLVWHKCSWHSLLWWYANVFLSFKQQATCFNRQLTHTVVDSIRTVGLKTLLGFKHGM